MIAESVSGQADALGFQFEEQDVPKISDEERRKLSLLATVVQDVALSERRYRERGLPSRWDRNDELFLFQVPSQKWEGTQTARASLGVPLVMEHIQAISPQIMDIMFEDDPPFYPLFHPATSQTDARANEALLNWEIDKSGFEMELPAVLESALLHGTGLMKFTWQFKNGYLCPHAEYVERRHVFTDASLRWPDIKKSKFVCHRMFRTPMQLNNMRREGKYDIPSLREMQSWAIPPKEQAPNSPIESQRTYASTQYSADLGPVRREQAPSIDPNHHPIELLEYVTPTKIITVLNRKRVIREEEQTNWNKVCWASAFFVRIDGQFDGLGLGQLLGDEQRLQQGVINMMLDNLSISIMSMFARKKGNSIWSQPVSVSPGKIIEVEDVNDIKELKVGGVDPTAFNVINDSDSRAARRSGANEVAVQGSFPESSGGIGRTAQGMNMLANAASSRLRRFVKIVENQVFIPFLEWLVETNPRYLSDNLAQMVLSPKLFQTYKENSDRVLLAGSKMKFQMLASTKMKRRQAMLQAVPTLIDRYENEQVLASLRQQGMKVDHSKLDSILFDVAGWPNEEEIIVPMDKQEIEQYQSENELVKELTILRAKLALESDAKIKQIDADSAGKIMKEIVKGKIDQNKMNDELTTQAANQAGQFAATQLADRYAPQGQTGGMGGQPTAGAGPSTAEPKRTG